MYVGVIAACAFGPSQCHFAMVVFFFEKKKGFVFQTDCFGQ